MIAGLIGEGGGDRALVPILRWLLGCVIAVDARVEWIDTTRFARGAHTLAERVVLATQLCPCNLLFIHRDSDRQPPEWRYQEIQSAAGSQPHVAVVPIRMTEAWLLVNESAIRQASGCVTGRNDLHLPSLAKLEDHPDPKETLHRALNLASGAKGRRAQRFDAARAVHRLADLVEDWSPLSHLSAFQRLEADTRSAITSLTTPIRPVT